MAPDLRANASALAQILREEPDTVRALVERIHRTMLWRYSTGRSLPDLERAVILEDLTDGRVSVRGWTHAPSEATA